MDERIDVQVNGELIQDELWRKRGHHGEGPTEQPTALGSCEGLGQCGEGTLRGWLGPGRAGVQVLGI